MFGKPKGTLHYAKKGRALSAPTKPNSRRKPHYTPAEEDSTQNRKKDTFYQRKDTQEATTSNWEQFESSAEELLGREHREKIEETSERIQHWIGEKKNSDNEIVSAIITWAMKHPFMAFIIVVMIFKIVF